MARTTQITREALVDAGVRLVLEKGLEALNARSLAAQAGCSIQPVFRNFGSMENLRAAVFRGLDAAYQSFIGARIDKADYLFTISLAHIALAQAQKNLFQAMFLTDEFGARTVEEIVQSSWNRETIDCTAAQYGLSLPKPYTATCAFTPSALRSACTPEPWCWSRKKPAPCCGARSSALQACRKRREES